MATETQDRPAAQRVQGTVYRSLPASLTVRDDPAHAEGAEGTDGLLRLHLSASSDQPYLRQSWWDEPWIEVLGHKDGEVDLARMNGGGAVLGNHDRYTAIGNTPLASIGMVEKAWLTDGRMEADIVISRREALSDLRQDILDGLVRNVSIGYQINARVLTKANVDGQPNEYRVTEWEPFEISLVDIPADATVGLGRSVDGAPQNYRVIDIPSLSQPAGSPGKTSQERTMDPEVENQVDKTKTITSTIELRGADPLAGERERNREIRELGKQFNMGPDAERAIDSGLSVESFRRDLLAKIKPGSTVTPAETNAIGMSARDMDKYSFCRAMLIAADPANQAYRKAGAFELECSEAARSKVLDGPASTKEREGGIKIPADMLAAPISNRTAYAEAATRALLERAKGSAAYRDLVVGAPASGGNLVATNLLASSFVELLRNKMVLFNLGATVLSDLSGNLAIPRQSGGASCYWVAESGAPTESQASFDQVPMTPHTVGAYSDYSRRLLLQASLDIEAFVRTDLALCLALGIDYAGFNGSGASNEPMGIFNQSGVGGVAIGTNGGAPTWDHIVQLEEAVAVANADVGALSYVTNVKVRSKLKRTQMFASTNGMPVWDKGGAPGVGDLNGYSAYATNQILSNYTKGASAGICSGIAFGNWADLIIGMWGGLDLMLDPYAMSTSGGKRVVALQDCDIAARRGGSFAVIKDALTT
ncbi:MAG TPA: phage major capsid protein [Rhodocyclaceae bacterium]|nr:phage major capsid protein [Rhodocyclaceae bacterium]